MSDQLCSLDDVKQSYFMNDRGAIPTTSSGVDDLLTDYIISITNIFQTYCDRDFISQEYTEYCNGNGKDCFYPRHYPITTISGIWDSTSWDWDDDTLIDSTLYRVKDDRGITYKPGYTFYDYTQNVKIIYTAGYAAADVPTDLKLACIFEVVRLWKSRKDVDVISESQADGSLTRLSKELLPITTMTLDKYTRKIVL